MDDIGNGVGRMVGEIVAGGAVGTIGGDGEGDIGEMGDSPSSTSPRALVDNGADEVVDGGGAAADNGGTMADSSTFAFVKPTALVCGFTNDLGVDGANKSSIESDLTSRSSVLDSVASFERC